jgi:hypothetical protein
MLGRLNLGLVEQESQFKHNFEPITQRIEYRSSKPDAEGLNPSRLAKVIIMDPIKNPSQSSSEPSSEPLSEPAQPLSWQSPSPEELVKDFIAFVKLLYSKRFY